MPAQITAQPKPERDQPQQHPSPPRPGLASTIDFSISNQSSIPFARVCLKNESSAALVYLMLRSSIGSRRLRKPSGYRTVYWLAAPGVGTVPEIAAPAECAF